MESEQTGRDRTDEGTDLEQLIAAALERTSRTAATAESLTGGNISARLSAIPGASDWYLGGVVAYDENVKFQLLGVDRGPVITASAAAQMASGVARLLEADVAVATTGVGGPGPQEDRPEGTVFVAVAIAGETTVREYHFDGDPSAIVEQTTEQAMEDLHTAIAGGPTPPGPDR
jgi:nicotinamide-nucleotide amidase